MKKKTRNEKKKTKEVKNVKITTPTATTTAAQLIAIAQNNICLWFLFIVWLFLTYRSRHRYMRLTTENHRQPQLQENFFLLYLAWFFNISITANKREDRLVILLLLSVVGMPISNYRIIDFFSCLFCFDVHYHEFRSLRSYRQFFSKTQLDWN